MANRFRSPLAAAIFRKLLEEKGLADLWQVGSAGTWAAPGQPVLAFVAQAAQTYGLDLSGHRSARVSAELLAGYDLILVMQASQKEALQSEFPALVERIYLLADVVERRTFDIPDTSTSLQGVMDVSADLDDLIRRGLQGICILATYLHNSIYQSGQHDR
jgi:protein-tyrosine-phosphatase